jgi:hypothetical protein
MTVSKLRQAKEAPEPAPAGASEASRRTWLGRPGPAQDPCRPQRTITLILLATVLLPIIAAVFEWQRYRWNRTFFYVRYPWGSWDAIALWIFALKTYFVLLPAAALCIVLAWRAWTRTAAALFLITAVMVLAWAGADLETFTRTGVHVTYYAQFIGAPDAMKWMGDVRSTARDAMLALMPLLGTAALTVVFAGVLATIAWGGGPGRHRVGVVTVSLLLLAHVLFIAGIMPAQALFTPDGRRADLQRVHDLLPYKLVWTAPGTQVVNSDAFRTPLDRQLEPLLRQAVPRMFAGPPADTSPQAIPDPAGPKPDIVLIVLDSLRFDAMVPDVMPRVSALAKEGVVLRQHHAGARITHLGLFTIFYGRTAGLYRTTLRAGVPPQACVSFRAAGYQTNYVSGVGHFAWARMQAFLNEPMFDRLRIVGLQDWPTSDRRALAVSRRILGGNEPPAPAAGGRAPQYLGVFLASTHYPYEYPPEFETRTPVAPPTWTILTADRDRDRAALINRYQNAVSFLDAAIGDFVDTIDRNNTVVVIMGDHGESFWDDGFLTHGTRWSDAQSHVPCIILAPNVAPRTIDEVTTHDDLLPTLLHLAGGKPVQPRYVTGRDLLGPAQPPPLAVTAADSQLNVFEMLVRRGDQRMLLEFRDHLPRIIVRGMVDEFGNIDAYSLPPASEAPAWAKDIEELVRRMTDLPRPAGASP